MYFSFPILFFVLMADLTGLACFSPASLSFLATKTGNQQTSDQRFFFLHNTQKTFSEDNNFRPPTTAVHNNTGTH